MRATIAALCVLLPLLPPAALGSASPGGELLAFFHGNRTKDGVLKSGERDLAHKKLNGIGGKSTLVLFTEKKGCRHCGEAERFVEEISSLSPQVSYEVLSLSGNAARAAELGIDKVPGMALLGAADPGIRYYGLPLGYEFEVFVEALVQVAEGRPELRPETVAGLREVKKPVTITVFVAET